MRAASHASAHWGDGELLHNSLWNTNGGYSSPTNVPMLMSLGNLLPAELHLQTKVRSEWGGSQGRHKQEALVFKFVQSSFKNHSKKCGIIINGSWWRICAQTLWKSFKPHTNKVETKKVSKSQNSFTRSNVDHYCECLSFAAVSTTLEDTQIACCLLDCKAFRGTCTKNV